MRVSLAASARPNATVHDPRVAGAFTQGHHAITVTVKGGGNESMLLLGIRRNAVDRPRSNRLTGITGLRKI
jgi:hypothetical protein